VCYNFALNLRTLVLHIALFIISILSLEVSYASDARDLYESRVVEQDEPKNKRKIINGGTISENQVLCQGDISSNIQNIILPSNVTGGIEGILLLRWEKQVIGSSGWEVISGANSLSYNPSTISSSTNYRRGARNSIYDPWVYSNIIRKEVVPGIDLIQVIKSDVTCKDGADGEIQIIVVGGMPEYTYDWSNGKTTQNIYDLKSDNYTLEVSDLNGCAKTVEVDILEPEFAVGLSIVGSRDVSCPDGSDAEVRIQGKYGTPPYNYEWSNGNSGDYVYSLSAGLYDVKVIDANGCSFDYYGLAVKEPAPFELFNKVSSTSCYGISDGIVELYSEGGTAPYYYYWDSGYGGARQTDLSAGAHSVFIFDDNDCLYEASITINEPEELEISPLVVNNKFCNGSINVVTTGGTAPYFYDWNNGETNHAISNLCPGKYEVIITDANGCQRTKEIDLNNEFTKEETSIKLVVNPVYTTGNIIVQLPFQDHVDIRVFTVSGQIVEELFSGIPLDDSEMKLAFDLDKYSNGIYLVEVITHGNRITEKIVVTDY